MKQAGFLLTFIAATLLSYAVMYVIYLVWGKDALIYALVWYVIFLLGVLIIRQPRQVSS